MIEMIFPSSKLFSFFSEFASSSLILDSAYFSNFDKIESVYQLKLLLIRRIQHEAIVQLFSRIYTFLFPSTPLLKCAKLADLRHGFQVRRLHFPLSNFSILNLLPLFVDVIDLKEIIVVVTSVFLNTIQPHLFHKALICVRVVAFCLV